MNYFLNVLDATTMYRTVLYVLISYVIFAMIGSFFGQIFFSITDMVFSLVVLAGASLATHYLCKVISGAPANIESTIITFLILFFILDPSSEIKALAILALVSCIAITSKYILAWRKLHILNPVALATVAIGATGLTYATWWIANPWMIVPVIVGGVIITHKIRRFPLVVATITSGLVATMIPLALKGQANFEMGLSFFVAWPIIFFATLMVTEPLSTPAGTRNHIMYGLVVGTLSSMLFSFGPVSSSPELALLIGNIIFYFTTIRGRATLSLVEKKQIARDTWEFVFKPSFSFVYKAGQYLEWTIPHLRSDSRGIRRYFTIASAPTDKLIRVGMKTPDGGSSFKKAMEKMETRSTMYVTSLDGDFVLPKDPSTKLVFFAGGIGVTPFTSMVRYLIDTKQKRDITLFYCNNVEEDIAWVDLWKEAKSTCNITTHHVLTKPKDSWSGYRGYINKEILDESGVDLEKSDFYISGPPAMVNAYKKMLQKNGVSSSRIITDFFPGLA